MRFCSDGGLVHYRALWISHRFGFGGAAGGGENDTVPPFTARSLYFSLATDVRPPDGAGLGLGEGWGEGVGFDAGGLDAILGLRQLKKWDGLSLNGANNTIACIDKSDAGVEIGGVHVLLQDSGGCLCGVDACWWK